MKIWQDREFSKLWVGQAISEMGSRLSREGLPMAAVLLMGVTPLSMTALSLASQLPAAIFGLIIGVWVDRLSRRPLMIGTDVARAILLLLFPVLAWIGWLPLWMFYAVAALTGILSLLFDVAYQAYVPSLVNRGDLVDANRWLSVSASFAEIVGPGMTGILVQWLTAPFAIGLDGLSYLVSAGSLAWIRSSEEKPNRVLHAHLPASTWKDELREGWDTLRHNRSLCALAGVSATVGFSSSAIFVLDTLYALRTLGLTTGLFGATVTIGGLGAMLGAVFPRKLVQRFGLRKTLIVSLTIRGLMAFTWVLAGGPIWRTLLLLAAWQLLGDASGTVYGILDSTLRQTLVSNEQLGRVNALMRVVGIALTGIGALVAGIIGQWFSIRVAMGFAAVGMTLSAIWIVWSPISATKSMDWGSGPGPS